MKKFISSRLVKCLLPIHVMFCLAFTGVMLTSSCNEATYPTDEITEEDIAHQKFAYEYFQESFENKVTLSHTGMDKLKKYVEDNGNDWRRIGLLPQKVSDNPKEVDMLVEDRTTKELVALFSVEITSLEMKSGSLKIKEFAWYLK